MCACAKSRSLRARCSPKHERRDVRISASGAGLHWDQLNEDISVSGLMHDAERRHLEERLKSVDRAVKIDPDDL
jgi:hypothetical protein